MVLSEDSHFPLWTGKPRATGFQETEVTGGIQTPGKRTSPYSLLLSGICSPPPASFLNVTQLTQGFPVNPTGWGKGNCPLIYTLSQHPFLAHLVKIHTICTYMRQNNLNHRLSPIVK